MKVRILTVVFAGILAAAMPGSGQSHEFIVKPGAASAKAGAALTATVYSTHSFLKGEEIEDSKITNVFVCSDGKRSPVTLQPDQAKLVYVGTLNAPTDKTFVLCGLRAGVTLATTAEGSKRGTRKDYPNAKLVRTIEKFSKAIINPSADDSSWSRPIGDRLEIMLKANPAGIKAGDEVPVQVLFDGKAIPTKILATYDGFSSRNMTFAFYAEMEDTDTAHVKITQPGTWIVRAEHTDDTRTAEIDRYIARAVLVLEVR